MPEQFMSTRAINGVTLALMRGNIVEVQADAIVNAANSGLRGGGGVDGAIHRAGGPRIMEECRRIGGCPTGSAVATTAGKLRAKYVFHAVGPVYSGRPEDARLLASAYASCLRLAEQHAITSIAFPSLSTGVYGYPLVEAAPIALRTVIEHIQQPTSLKQVLFVLFRQEAYEAFVLALDEVTG
ncbi:MAG TPA: O-acetyl-ADP-ribose deacetylase [Ktedonobacteraceae bacterium]|nr:O-acetyl-ADP-ribose deacetylase [Ktedonobacteraceae bacterium]